MARKIDTVTVEVVRNLLMSIAEETYGLHARRARRSSVLDRRDVCTAVIDPDGNIILTGKNVEEAYPAYNSEDGNKPIISFKLDDEGTKIFAGGRVHDDWTYMGEAFMYLIAG